MAESAEPVPAPPESPEPPESPARPEPLAPPTSPDPSAARKRDIVWPMVLGVIAIILGGLGAAMNAIGTIAPWVMLILDLPQEMRGGQIAPLSSAVSAVGTLLSALLLAGGVALLMRRRFAVRCLLIWSWLRIVHGFAVGAVQALGQMQAFEQMGDPTGGRFAYLMAGFILLFSVAWSAALPVFMLIWFARRKVKADVAEHFPPRAEAAAV